MNRPADRANRSPFPRVCSDEGPCEHDGENGDRKEPLAWTDRREMTRAALVLHAGDQNEVVNPGAFRPEAETTVVAPDIPVTAPDRRPVALVPALHRRAEAALGGGPTEPATRPHAAPPDRRKREPRAESGPPGR